MILGLARSREFEVRETLACIEVAVAMRLIQPPDAKVFDRLNRVIATLVRLAMH